MKTASIGRATVLALLASTLVVGTGCSKERIEQEPEPTEDVESPEVQAGRILYTLDDDKGLNAQSALCDINIYDDSGLPIGSQQTCQVEVGLERIDFVRDRLLWIYGEEEEIVEKPLSSTHITGIELITQADYDEEHPKGSSLNDIMELRFLSAESTYSSIALTDYFETYPTLDITGIGRVFTLEARTLPAEKNHIVGEDGNLAIDVTLKLTLDDETVLSIDPIPGILDQPTTVF